MTLYAKATAIGVVTGLLVPPIIVGIGMLVFAGVAATGGGGIARVSAGIAEAVPPTLLLLVAAGFVAGFAWTIRKARRHANR